MQDNYYGDKLPYMMDLLAPAPVQVVVLCPSAETVRRREEARGKTGYRGFSVDALYQSFMADTPRVGLWLDNSNQTPQETARQIADSLDANE